MSALGEGYGTAAPPHEFTHEGKTYKVRLVNDAVKIAVEKRLYARARDVVRESKADLSAAEYAEQLRLLNRDYQAGEFALESKRGARYLKTQAGALQLASLLFGCEEMEMIRLWGERPAEVGALLKLVLAESGLEENPAEDGVKKNAGAGGQPPPEEDTTPDDPRLF